MEKAGVDVRKDTEVTPKLAEQLKPDVLIIAVGAEPIIPPLPGIDGTNVIIANNLPEKYEEVGQKVAVLGGGLVGCETALHLAMDGKEVTVIEMLDIVCPDANPRYRPSLMTQLEKYVTRKTGMRGVSPTSAAFLKKQKNGAINRRIFIITI